MSLTVLAAVVAKLSTAGVAAKAAVGTAAAVAAIGTAGAAGVVPLAGADDPAAVESASTEQVDAVVDQPAAEPVAVDSVEPVEPVVTDTAPSSEDTDGTGDAGGAVEEEPATEPEGGPKEGSFGATVSADARDGGVDGAAVSEAARNKPRPEQAQRPATAGKPEGKGAPAGKGRPAAPAVEDDAPASVESPELEAPAPATAPQEPAADDTAPEQPTTP